MEAVVDGESWLGSVLRDVLLLAGAGRGDAFEGTARWRPGKAWGRLVVVGDGGGRCGSGGVDSRWVVAAG
jgi:hypothetical protein